MQILGISADHSFSQKAFAKDLKLNFPLLSDRGRKVIKAYGVYLAEKDIARRSYFLVGKDGKILWMHIMANPKQKLDEKVLYDHVRKALGK